MRYAIYFAPAFDSALHTFGSTWLGRDALTNAAIPQPPIPGLSPERQRELTESPRRYGFHATLKPPFAIREGERVEELESALEAFARDTVPFSIAGLRLIEIAGFLAFGLAAPSASMHQLADAAVLAFDRFRRPPDSSELTRRNGSHLNSRERELLHAWGYPYVLDAWRFHMTLSERANAEELELLKSSLTPLAERFVSNQLRIDAISLFVEPFDGAPFACARRIPLTGAAQLEASVCP